MQRSGLFAACMICLAIYHSPASAIEPAMKKTSSSITDFGAVEDGATINTRAIQAAIDHVASAAGGTVIIPAGTFLSGAIFLKPRVALQLDKDAVLKASTNIADYPLTNTRIEGHFQDWVPALVNAEKIDNLRITGNGTLDGSGKPFWEEFWRRYKADPKTKNLDVLRPRLLFVSQCNDAQISGISLKDSAFWNLHVYNCDGVAINGLERLFA